MARRKDPLTETPVDAPAEMPEAAEAAAPALVTEREAVAVPVASPRRSGVLGPLLGGALAAIGGFGLSHFNVLGFATNTSSDLTALGDRLDAILSKQAADQASALDAMRAETAGVTDRVAALEAAPAPEPPDLSRLDDLDRRLQAMEALPAGAGASTTAIAAKLAELERRLAALPATGAAPELQAELDAAVARLTEAEAEAKARAEEAEAAAKVATMAEARRALADAVASGEPFASELAAVADPALTTALSGLAETGVPTLAMLQADFPDAARAALRQAREISAEDGWGSRLADFLASQTGARSVAPREGDDPDAVLSRAEFALGEGRVADALAELEPLEASVKAPLAPWIDTADQWLAADAALTAAGGE
jgi:hypothetical protein